MKTLMILLALLLLPWQVKAQDYDAFNPILLPRDSVVDDHAIDSARPVTGYEVPDPDDPRNDSLAWWEWIYEDTSP